ncbi:MAG: zinc-ribbon domain-containing protein [Candidatus Paceibacterota bacterium]|jgi:uncharacterized membrane protein YvbJ
MALLPCSQCGQAVSDEALTCPHCGAPTVLGQSQLNRVRARLNRNKKIVLTGTVVMALILIPAIVYLIVFGFLGKK